jgi:molybdopterin/thiamine biosynthesis adenylyltransferase
MAEWLSPDAPPPAVAVPPRGARLPAFHGLTGEAGPALDALSVAVVGAGSVGRNLALHLARLQVGELRVVDPGRYKPESLLTQPITAEDVGAAKAGNTARACRQLSPATRVWAFDGPAQALSPAALADVDVVLLATDNLAAEVEVGQRCLWLRRPLLQASVHGDTLVAQVRFLRNADGAGPCLACAFGPAEWRHLNRETTFSCEGRANGRAAGRTVPPPTLSVSFLCSLAADLALTQLLRFALRLGAPLQDAVLEHCGYTHRTVLSPLKRNADCPCDHAGWERASAPRPLADCTARELARLAGLDGGAGAGGISLAVDDMPFVEWGACAACGQGQRVGRFGPAGRCADCGGPVEAQPFYTHRAAPAALLRPVLDRPLRELGAAAARAAVVRGAGRAVLVR